MKPLEALDGMKEAFEDALDLKADDWPTRLVYADWLEEAGDWAGARCQRWLAANHKYPVRGLCEGHSWDWFGASGGYVSVSAYAIPSHARLPGYLYCMAEGSYSTRREAEAALVESFRGLGQG